MFIQNNLILSDTFYPLECALFSISKLWVLTMCVAMNWTQTDCPPVVGPGAYTMWIKIPGELLADVCFHRTS